MKKQILFIIIVLCLSQNAFSEITIYDIDFSSPTHIVGTTPATGGASDQISSIVCGQPTVENSFGFLTDQPLVFNPNIDRHEGIGLNLGMGYDNYKISFDIETQNLVDADYMFSVYLTGVYSPSLKFNDAVSNGKVKCFIPFIRPYSSLLGFFSDNTLMHVEIDADLINQQLTIDIDDLGINYTDELFIGSDDINNIGFSLHPNYGLEGGIDPNVSVGIDNIKVTSNAVPEPSAMFLFVLGVIGFLRKKFLK